MKKLYIILLLVFFNSCCADCPDDLQKAGPLDETVFKQKDASFGKMLQGNDGIYNYKAFGNYKNSATEGVFIPKDISFIEQTLIGSDERTIIKVDENFLPISFYKINNGIKDSMEYHVYYVDEETLIRFDKENEDGTYTTISKIRFPVGFQNRSQESTKNQKNSNCDIFNEDSDINPCSDNNIYEDIAQDWEDYTEGTPIQGVGKAVSWIIQISVAKICSNNNKSKQSSGLSCEDLKENKSIEDLCGILLSCEPDCAGKSYGAAYKVECETCVGGKTNKLPLTISINFSTSNDCFYRNASVIGGIPPYTYQWSSGGSGTNSMGCNLPVGTKNHLIVFDSQGCSDKFDFEVMPPVTNAINTNTNEIMVETIL